MVNVITKRPKKTKTVQAQASVMTGSYSSNREELSVSGPVSALPKTYFLLTASDYERFYPTPITTLRNRSVGLTVQQDLGSGGTLVGQLGYMRNQTHSPLSTVPELYNAVTKRYEGLAFDLATLNQNGPKSETSRDVYDATLTFEQRLNDTFSVRASTGWWHRHKWLFNAGNGSQYDYMNKVLAKGTPVKGLINEDGGNVQADLLARYKLFGDKVDNKTLLTFDFSDYYRWDPNWQLANAYQITNTATTVAPAGPYWFKNIFIGQPIDYSVPDFNTAVYNNITRYNKNRASVWGGNLRQQATLLGDRLMAFASLRYDMVKLNLHNYLGAGQVVNGTSTAWSPSVGFNYKATSKFAVYGSRSNGFNANAQNQSAASGLQPNERSYGYDYGVKASLLDDRLVFTTGGYYIVRRNVSDTELLPNGTTVASYSGSQLARGVEFDFTYRVTDDLTFVGGYGHVNSKYTYFGRSIGAVGYPTSKVAPDNAGVAAKYNLSGALKGFSVNAGIQYLSKIAAENPNTGDIFAAASAGGGFIGNDGRRDIKIPSYATIDLGLHYTFHVGDSRLRHTIDLNLKNVTDKNYITAARFPGDGRGVYVTYRLGL
jgi:iron complex outermembrane receptor protein